MIQAYWAEDKAYPEEGGGTIIASSEEEATTAALRMLNVERDGVTLYTAETAEGAIKEKLEELNDAMQKSSRAARDDMRSQIRAQIARKAHWRGAVGDHSAREALGDLDAWVAELK